MLEYTTADINLDVTYDTSITSVVVTCNTVRKVIDIILICYIERIRPAAAVPFFACLQLIVSIVTLTTAIDVTVERTTVDINLYRSLTRCTEDTTSQRVRSTVWCIYQAVIYITVTGTIHATILLRLDTLSRTIGLIEAWEEITTVDGDGRSGLRKVHICVNLVTLLINTIVTVHKHLAVTITTGTLPCVIVCVQYNLLTPCTCGVISCRSIINIIRQTHVIGM